MVGELWVLANLCFAYSWVILTLNLSSLFERILKADVTNTIYTITGRKLKTKRNLKVRKKKEKISNKK